MPYDQSNMVLRYYIGFEHPEQRFEELVDFLTATGIHRVVLFSSSFVEGSSILPLSYYEQHAAMLRPYAQRLKAMGVEVGINVLMTIGHCYYADEQEFGLRRAVTVNGEPSRGCVCYRDENLLKLIKQQYQYYAALKPSVLFTDDDIRANSMGQLICLCDEHVRMISQRVGRALTVEEIRAHIFTDSFETDEIKQAYFDQIKEDIEFLISEIADAVHEVSPETEIGVMTTSYPSVTLDRDLSTFFDKLYTDKKVTRIRTGMDFYREGDHNDIPLAFSMPLIQREFMGHGCPTEIQPEIENDTYGFFYKSNAVTKMQLVWCLTNGMQNMQVNLFDYENCDDCNYRDIKQMFRDNSAYFNTITKLVPVGHRTEGVGIYVHPRSLLARRTTDRSIVFRSFWHKWLNLMGIPVSSDLAKAQCLFLTGDDIALASDAQIDDILKKGVILDKRAAEVLFHRGFASRIGIESICNLDSVFAGERFTQSELNTPYQGSHNSNYFCDSLISPSLIASIQYAEGAQSLSNVINHRKEKVCNGVTVFENPDKERFCILPFDYNGFSFFTNVNGRRQHQLLHVFEWLSRKPLPVRAQNEKMCVNINSFEDRNVITLFNLASDEIPTPKLTYRVAGKLQYLDQSGKLKRLKYRTDGDTIVLQKSMKALDVLVLVDQRKG